MSDPLRTDPASDIPPGAERDAKIEQLLLTGLDHYFDGQYDQAINIWTRALFLDRGHARARAYIERARGALAEQQRESEELLQRGLAAFDRGASGEARRLLEIAITRGAPRDEALSVLDRIHRLGPAEGLVLPSDDIPDERQGQRWRGSSVARTLRLTAWLGLAISVVVAAFVTAGAIPFEWTWTRTPPAQTGLPALSPAPADPGLQMPRRGERALTRARVLTQGGRLRDALVSLEQVTITDVEKVEADRLRADIQRQLMTLGQTSTETSIPARDDGSESMKCPKCGYLGFEEAERCRNCGYDFGPTTAPAPELTLRFADREVYAADDLDLVDAAAPSRRAAGARPSPSSPAARTSVATPPQAHDLGELPLFTDDVPLITRASAPRAPLSVRRATPDVPRLHPEPLRTPPLEFQEAELDAPIDAPKRVVVRASPPERPSAVVSEEQAAGLGLRFFAAGLDLVLLALVDLAVVYFTAQICGLSTDELLLLPLGPLVTFLIVQNGGYLVAFTAGGQTIGKMLAGIRVVAAEPGASLDLGRSLLRTVVWSLMALPAGLGLLTALFNHDRQGLHDRFAGTKVIRAIMA